jgi:hypothetical protein
MEISILPFLTAKFACYLHSASTHRTRRPTLRNNLSGPVEILTFLRTGYRHHWVRTQEFPGILEQGGLEAVRYRQYPARQETEHP